MGSGISKWMDQLSGFRPRHWADNVFRFVYPPVCAGCGRINGAGRGLCPACWKQVAFIERPYCDILGIPFSHDLGAGILSAQAIAEPPVFNRLRAAVVHQGVARRLVHGLKYKDRTDLAPMMAGWMVRASDGWLSRADGIIPVPLHRRRLFIRKYNQSAELARQISTLSGVTLMPLAILRHKNTARQVGLSISGRTENLRGAFGVTDEGAGQIFGRRIVLVDDVYTTGATANAAARALRAAGAADVTVLTFAMALPDTI